MKAIALSESQFQFAFALATICFRLAVGAARDLIVCVKRTAGPFAQTVIRAHYSQHLNRAQNRECEEKKRPNCSEHDTLPHKKWGHRIMMSAARAIPFSIRLDREAGKAKKCLIQIHTSHAT